MTKKYWVWAVLFVFFAAISFAASKQYRQKVDETLVRGHYAFADVRQNIQRMHKIELTENGQNITLYRDGDFWHFKEAADYFVNNQMLMGLYDIINNAMIISMQPVDEKIIADLQQNGVIVKIFDKENKLLEEMSVAAESDKDKSRLAYKKGAHVIYRIGPVKIFSGKAEFWMPMPLLALAEDAIAGIYFNDTYISSEVFPEAKAQTMVVRQLLSLLQYLPYNGIALQQDFATANFDAKPISMNIYLKSGLIYKLNLYAFSDSYWLKINLAAEKIANMYVPEQIEQLRPYYADWVFQLSNEDGKILYSVMAQ